jgi:DNA-binding NtrC family response regulator
MEARRLDEIGDLTLEIEVKLLRLIEEREFRPVGALHGRKIDLRIIAATHRDWKAERAAGQFRQDLYYGLNVVTRRLPPLRGRREDIPLLLGHLIDLGQAEGLPKVCAGGDVVRALMSPQLARQPSPAETFSGPHGGASFRGRPRDG